MPLVTHLAVTAFPFGPPPPNIRPPAPPIRNSTCDAFVDHAIVVSPSPEPSLVMGFGAAPRLVPATTFAGIGGSGAGFEQAAASAIAASTNALAGQMPAISFVMPLLPQVYVTRASFNGRLAECRLSLSSWLWYDGLIPGFASPLLER